MSLAALMLLAAVQEAPWERAPLPDPVLAQQRGGFRLPSGVEISLSVRTDTAVNGALVLRTVFSADQGAPTVAIYAPRTGTSVASGLGQGSSGTTTVGSPTVTYDGRGNIQVTPAVTTIAVSGAGRGDAGAAIPAGLIQVGAGAVTDAGTIAEAANGLARAVTLQGPDISVTHLVGTALGSVIANAGSNRTIDTQTSVAIDLHGAGPDVVGSSMLRVQGVAESALQERIR